MALIPLSGSTKRSSSGVPLIGGLYKSDPVSVYVGSDKKEYQVPRGLIRGLSEYFDRAFGDNFVEGVSGKIELPVVKPWVFECFINWLYNHEIFWESSEELGLDDQPKVDRDVAEDRTAELLDADETYMAKPTIARHLPFLTLNERHYYQVELTKMWFDYYSNPPDSPARAQAEAKIRQARTDLVMVYTQLCDSGYAVLQADEFTDADLVDPVSWDWQSLFELYVFADMFETRRLRTAVIELVQVKTFQTRTREYLLPNMAACSVAFKNLPDTADLCKWLADIIIYTKGPDTLSTPESFQLLPSQTLALLSNRAIQLAWCNSCSACTHGHPCEDRSHPDIKTTRTPYMNNLCLGQCGDTFRVLMHEGARIPEYLTPGI
ncbi:hypothetical protein LTR56_024369 [Elasticomyces elasticus]|nr:hypothetical protein LTR56_024369 [Elasticomyces elasticus]KAK3644075.1 hypothetical protein LTR22_015397 [Elasticomyces elasticus]KAK4921999.1 hypothetical protein LTR49_010584 [Elasticomyces elasticus]KAK5768820.1 hypothetical protein LTS12_000880 [Elasticomyces elasticus]